VQNSQKALVTRGKVLLPGGGPFERSFLPNLHWELMGNPHGEEDPTTSSLEISGGKHVLLFRAKRAKKTLGGGDALWLRGVVSRG